MFNGSIGSYVSISKLFQGTLDLQSGQYIFIYKLSGGVHDLQIELYI